MINKNNVVDIIGAGPAGLAVGYFAKKLGLNPVVYEKSDAIGGNCRTIVDGEFRYDTGAHRFHDKNDRVTSEIKSLIGRELQKVRSPSKIFHKEKMIEFPLRIPDVFLNMDPSVITRVIYENIINRVMPASDPSSFKQLAYKKYGKTLAELFLISYTEKLWGTDTDLLDPTVAGGRFKDLNLKSIIRKFIQNDKYKPQHIEGDFYYPRYGFGKIFDALGAYIGKNNIFLNTPINLIHHNEKMIESLETAGGNKMPINSLVSTLPLNLLVNSMRPLPPKEIISCIANIDYRSIRLCILYLDLERFTENASLYFPDIDCPFTRIYEPKNRSSKMAPEGKTCIVIEVPINQNNIILDTPRQEVYSIVLKYLINHGLINEEQILNYKMHEIEYAYPIIYKNIRNDIKNVISYFSGFDNLRIIGRNATFEYLHTHDLIEQAEKLVKPMV